jgi:hypothetical protein
MRMPTPHLTHVPPPPRPDNPPSELERARAELADRAIAQYRSGNLVEAEQLFRELTRRFPDAKAFVSLGQVLAQLGRYDAAEAAYRDAVARDRNNADASRGLQLLRVLKAGNECIAAEACLRSGQWAEALAHLQSAGRINPNDARIAGLRLEVEFGQRRQAFFDQMEKSTNERACRADALRPFQDAIAQLNREVGNHGYSLDIRLGLQPNRVGGLVFAGSVEAHPGVPSTPTLSAHGFGALGFAGTSTDQVTPAQRAKGPSAAPEREFGWLSRLHEVGTRGADFASTGKNDPGGVSYGTYQLNSTTVQDFVNQHYREQFHGLTPGTQAFADKWAEVAKKEGARFGTAQRDYMQQTHYAPIVRDLNRTLGVNVENRSSAVQNVIFSTAVQHGATHAPGLLHRAMQPLLRNGAVQATDEEIIHAIYAERGRRDANGVVVYFQRSPRVTQQSQVDRYRREEQDALRALREERGSGH